MKRPRGLHMTHGDFKIRQNHGLGRSKMRGPEIDSHDTIPNSFGGEWDRGDDITVDKLIPRKIEA